MKFDPQHFARQYTRLLHKFACHKSQWADAYYAGCMSDHNAWSQVVWSRWADECDQLVDEVDCLAAEVEALILPKQEMAA